MRSARRILPLLLALVLTGCTVQNAPSQPEEPDSGTASETAAEAEPYLTGDVLPVLSIETKSQAENVMDFVTEPVAEHVAKSIASWTPGYKMPPAPYYEACTVTLTDAGGKVLLSGADADVKVRGNWTTTYNKKPLRLKFAEGQEMLGLNDDASLKNWVLLAEYKDGSMLRNKAALEISQSILGKDGLYSADAALVEVEINGQYWGVYLLTEQQQVNADRVAVTKPENGYEGTDIGYFLEYDGYFTQEDALHAFAVDYAGNAPLVPFDGEDGGGRTLAPLPAMRDKQVGMSIKSDIYSQEQHDFIEHFVCGAYEILYAAAYEDKALAFNADFTEIAEDPSLTPQQAAEQVINAESLADMYIISELTCDADIYWSSFFLDADFGADGDKRLTFEAPWDFDSAMGNKNRCPDGTGFYAANILKDVNDQYDTINPWLAVLMYEDWFRDIIRDRWTAAYDAGVFSDACAQIRSDAQTLEPAFTRNYRRWDNLLHNEARNELSRRAANCRTQAEAADYLAEWLETRVAFLNDYWHA